jgi:hypothetical protein
LLHARGKTSHIYAPRGDARILSILLINRTGCKAPQ